MPDELEHSEVARSLPAQAPASRFWALWCRISIVAIPTLLVLSVTCLIFTFGMAFTRILEILLVAIVVWNVATWLALLGHRTLHVVGVWGTSYSHLPGTSSRNIRVVVGDLSLLSLLLAVSLPILQLLYSGLALQWRHLNWLERNGYHTLFGDFGVASPPPPTIPLWPVGAAIAGVTSVAGGLVWLLLTLRVSRAPTVSAASSSDSVEDIVADTTNRPD